MRTTIVPHQVVLPRFGEATYADDDVIEFPWGLPGFADHRRFLVLALDEQAPYLWLQSLDDPKVALPIVDPWQIFADYRPALPYYARVALDLVNPADFAIYCVVVCTAGAEDLTINLLAPVVINHKARRARQVMLEGSPYSVRQPIPRSAAPKEALHS
ncbi:flagellar assembly protein FliW [bacterium]|nr:MAG: flagellar assembly protein FliW [bacterium]